MSPEKVALKLATREMIGQSGAGGELAAPAFCRVGKTKLNDYHNERHEASFAPVDVVLDLDRLARGRLGFPPVTRMLCQLLGGDFIERPAVPAGRGDLMTLLAGQSHEMAELTSALLLGLADGRLSGAEARKALSEAQQVAALSARMIAELTVIVNEGEDA